ncbi:MAG: hypothetical protein J6S85_02765 [Methanobrevibacter sp.]|nr:hypothetical protein [Methanobrevibacter sp.]MBO7712462.1 hypothetical protein [Methanobrevibacter sp.]
MAIINTKDYEAKLFEILPTFPDTPFDKGKREGIMAAILMLKKMPDLMAQIKDNAVEFRDEAGIYCEGIDFTTLDEIVEGKNG